MRMPEGLTVPIIHEPLIPLAVGSKKNMGHKNGHVLAGDVGGTKTNLALFEIKDGRLFLQKQNSYRTKDYTSLLEIIQEFEVKEMDRLDSICFGVAGPITDGKVHGTNFPWDINTNELVKVLGLENVFLINDMQANAYGLTALEEKDLDRLKYGSKMLGNAVIISPGTGLGEAGLYWDGTAYHPFASEGGHCDFSPRNDFDLEIWKYFQQKYGHVSWERLLSGQGICDTYQMMREVRGGNESEAFKAKMKKEDPAAVITKTAMEGTDAVCRETLDLFVRFLAIETAQLALKFKATGGIYIGGGILPKIIKGMNREVFNDNFMQSGRLNSLLQMVPVNVILNDNTALLGAGYYAAMSIE
ncbi:glucokinase [Cyclobacterium qasimii]|uniref:Glucokinase n=2 Tax=Cyclobacterium qasimii TaxID=1350429 RepID=S7V9V0_9BACT|nr:glucokinase [Cyclobacterium qasimii]EPR66357.1 Glucokinase [Cyclobacterium qasimii M12-11B]GEO21173.1 glucokinase [Cyclobacterium qasimii]